MELWILTINRAMGISKWKMMFVGSLIGTLLLVTDYVARLNWLMSSFGNDIPSSSVLSHIWPFKEKILQQPEYNFTTAKKILYFTSYYGMTDFDFGFGHEPFVNHGCPVSNCYATNDRNLLPKISDYDAVLFHMRNMDHGTFEIPNQTERRAAQRYIMFLMESPSHDGFPYHLLKNFFNWTMTYRQDSDIPHLYGYIDSKSLPYTYPPSLSEIKKWMRYKESVLSHGRAAEDKALIYKNKLVAWIVSNCGSNSQRENYVNELRKHIQVDIMGNCGDVVCDNTWENVRNGDSCTLAVERDYKFYLSFENSFCKDYATEKFFTRMNQNVVVITFGKADYAAIAPPHSYINALDYESPKQLANYLLKLDSDDEAYLSYFWWKQHYSVQVDSGATRAFCRLCAKLNDPAEPAKVYEDMTDWWVKGGDCEQIGSYPWSNSDFSVTFMREYSAKILRKSQV